MTKQEKIEESYGTHWYNMSQKLKDIALENNGYIHQRDAIKELGQNISLSEYFDDREGLSQRPKSLQGIEDNNGWIKIENEKDLPEKTGDYFVYTCLGRLETFHYVYDAFSPNYFMSHVTHYKPIVKPKPPIY